MCEDESINQCQILRNTWQLNISNDNTRDRVCKHLLSTDGACVHKLLIPCWQTIMAFAVSCLWKGRLSLHTRTTGRAPGVEALHTFVWSCSDRTSLLWKHKNFDTNRGYGRTGPRLHFQEKCLPLTALLDIQKEKLLSLDFILQKKLHTTLWIEMIVLLHSICRSDQATPPPEVTELDLAGRQHWCS